MTGQFHARKSLEIVTLQPVAEGAALISAVNCRFAGESRATMAGRAKRGRQSAPSLRFKAPAVSGCSSASSSTESNQSPPFFAVGAKERFSTG